MAGTGKSTIARTVASTLHEKGRLGASFFFSRVDSDRSSANKFFTTLAVQLVKALPALKSYVCDAIANNGDIPQLALSNQWEHLIFHPLSLLEGCLLLPLTLVLVIDALDECKDDRDLRIILRLLTQVTYLKTIQLRVFVTSRPETPIRLGFREMTEVIHHEEVLHQVSRSIVDHGVALFLRHEFDIITKERFLKENWPGAEIIKELVQKADRLFIYAATVCRFIGDRNFLPNKRLALVLQGGVDGRSSTLDKIYTQILQQSVDGDYNMEEKDELSERFRQIVGSIVALFDPLSTVNLSNLLSMPKESIDITLGNLHSVLDVSQNKTFPIRLLHLSFHDFLLDKKRCSDTQFWVCEKKVHRDLVESCLRVMSSALRRDMCNLRKPGCLASEVEPSQVDQYLPGHVQYACQYWTKHLERLKEPQGNAFDLRQVHMFLKEHFLHWLEALSLMGKTSLGVLMIVQLENLTVSEACHWVIFADANGFEQPKPSELYALVCDAKRFILKYRSVIELAPLQVYSGTLLFSPQASIVRNLFQKKIDWVRISSGVEQNWSPALQTLEGHSDFVRSVVFSPDGTKLASGSADGTVRVWDMATGQVEHTLEGHSDWVWSVAFAPDGSKLASGSDDRTVRVWDMTTGQVERTLEGHSDWVRGVAFSPDGSRLASGSEDRTVRVWDVVTGQAECTLEGHSDRVWSVVFSPDGTKLASGSADRTVRVWDMITGQVDRTLEGHSDWVRSLVFSPDGSKLASESEDRTVRVWDVATGQVERKLEGHSNWVRSIAFSPDGSRLASGSEDGTVRVWDVVTGQVERKLEGHSDWVRSVDFSPDGSKLASGSGDKTVRVWNMVTGQVERTLEGHSDRVRSIAFSPGGSKLASGSGDRTVRVWNMVTGQVERTLEGHSDWVRSIAFSPDGSKLASGSGDRTVRVWDVATGQVERTLEGHSDRVKSVAFSPDGSKLASGSDDKTVQMWNVATGQVERTLEGHLNWVRSVVFSPDGTKLASGSSDRTVRVWDVATGQVERTLEGHSNWVRSVVFSPNGSKLASGSADGTVQVWDVATGQVERTLEGNSEWVKSVVFSPDGSKPDSGQPAKTRHRVEPRSFYSVDKSNLWVTQDGSRILYLPPDHRPGCIATEGSTIAIGARSGRVTIMTFCSDVKI
jgi:WD40 repeat protein